MTPERVPEARLRTDRLELSRLAWALGISVAFHLLCFGGYKLGREFGVWNWIRVPEWVHKSKLETSVREEAKEVGKPQEPPPQQEVPLMFVDVNPQLAMSEPPENPKFYANRNTQSSNPDIDEESDIPKIDGKQQEILKTEDVARSPFDRLQPVFPNPEPEEEHTERAKPTTPEPQGDLAMAKPDIVLRQDTGTAERPRVRTLREALQRDNRNQLAGEKMEQRGGVKRHLEFTGLDAKATLMGDYDASFIAAVENRWFTLLDNLSYDGDRRGRVVLKFHLTFDGRITDMEVVENTVNESLSLLCQKAVIDPAPFERWPREMRRMIDKDFREIQFAFYYN